MAERAFLRRPACREAATRRRLLPIALALLVASLPAAAQDDVPIAVQRAARPALADVGLPVGARIPSFEAQDQNGVLQTFDSIRGPKGAVIYFYRSADWCIYCRSQLVETQAGRAELRRNGLDVVGVSYDSPEILKRFADEHGIEFPLLSDPDSSIIRAFDILDRGALPGSAAYGVPYHGSYIVDADGVVVAKLFDVEATLSHSTGIVVSRLFGSPANTHMKTVAHERLTLNYYALANQVAPGDEVELVVDVRMREGLHVYAPQEGSFIPVEWTLEPSEAYAAQPVVYPSPEVLAVGGTRERAAVYSGEFRLSRRIKVGPATADALEQGNVVVEGALSFQACGNEMCYLPTSVDLEWKLPVVTAASTHAAHHH